MVMLYQSFVAFSGFISMTSALYAPKNTCSTHDLSILSCSAESQSADTCCTESPGGLLLLTQLYNWNPGKGPKDSWTVHGLWPDFCNGSYPASCDNTRNYTDIKGTLKKYRKFSLLKYMEEFWRVRRVPLAFGTRINWA